MLEQFDSLTLLDELRRRYVDQIRRNEPFDLVNETANPEPTDGEKLLAVINDLELEEMQTFWRSRRPSQATQYAAWRRKVREKYGMDKEPEKASKDEYEDEDDEDDDLDIKRPLGKRPRF